MMITRQKYMTALHPHWVPLHKLCLRPSGPEVVIQLPRSACNTFGPGSSSGSDFIFNNQLRSYLSSFRICAEGANDSLAQLFVQIVTVLYYSLLKYCSMILNWYKLYLMYTIIQNETCLALIIIQYLELI